MDALQGKPRLVGERVRIPYLSMYVDTNLLECEKLLKENPDELLAMLDQLSPTLLTFVAELIGQELPWDKCGVHLLRLVKHEEPVVREGALYGLVLHAGHSEVTDAFVVAVNDVSPGVSSVAKGLTASLSYYGVTCFTR